MNKQENIEDQEICDIQERMLTQSSETLPVLLFYPIIVYSTLVLCVKKVPSFNLHITPKYKINQGSCCHYHPNFSVKAPKTQRLL